ncbi:MAG: sulfite exporter TauE/SafE family protein [Gemmobacter sp.]|nr:sulfite exporter TauE/SafE family protein [Gemmobacter sp.]
MDVVFGGLAPWAFWTACAVTLGAGFVKGAIGFAMPLIMMSAFGSFMAPDLALAGLILATVTTNIHQALRDGWPAARASAWKYRRMIGMILAGIVLTAPLVPYLPQRVLMGLLAVPVLAFALVQIAGVPLKLKLEHQNRAEYGLGLIGGLYGGVSGIWGPPVIVYLLSVGVAKAETVRVQGVTFLLGAIVLMGAHLTSGVLNATTLPFSAALIVPAAIGMWLGFRLQDRLDPVRFRRWTLILLALTAANLLRRAVMG